MLIRLMPQAVAQDHGKFQVPGIATGTVIVHDEGAPLGVVEHLDFVGSGVGVSASGAYATISIPGGGGGGSIEAWDDGIPQGSGTVIDFGNSLDATVSGSVIRVDARGGSGQDVFFLWASGSDVSTYRRLMDTPGQATSQLVATALGAAVTGTVATFITEPGVPGVDILPDGIWHLHVHAARTVGGNPTNIMAEFFHRTVGGVETHHGYSEISPQLTASETEYDLDAFLNEMLMATSERVGVRILALHSGGGNPTVTLTVEGTTVARLEFPVSILSAAVLVVQDDGVPLGTIRTIDAGAGLAASVSGTVARIDVAPPITGSFILMEEGAPLGSVTRLNVRSPGAVASVSGTYGDLAILGPFSGTVVGADEGTVVGSAPIINFRGAGVQASLSGSFLDVAIPGGGSGFDLYDEGALQGSVTGLDVAGGGLKAFVSGSRGLIQAPGTFALTLIAGDGVNVIGTGSLGTVRLGVSGTITSYETWPDQSGCFQADIRIGSYGQIPFGNQQKRSASAPITLSHARKSQDNSLVGWSGSFGRDDWIELWGTTGAFVRQISIGLAGVLA